jgi:hypothetical protein
MCADRPERNDLCAVLCTCLPSLSPLQKTDFRRVFPGASPDAVDLLERMLQVGARAALQQHMQAHCFYAFSVAGAGLLPDLASVARAAHVYLLACLLIERPPWELYSLDQR